MFKKYLYLSSVILFIVSWLEPTYTKPWPAFNNEFLAFGALFLLYLAELKKDKHLTWFYYVFAFISVSFVVQIWFLPHFFVNDLLTCFIYLLSGLLAYQCGISVNSQTGDAIPSTIAIIFVVGGVVGGLIAIVQWLGISHQFITSIEYGERAAGNMGQPNNLATSVIISFVALIFLWWLDKVGSILFFFLSFCLLMAVVLTESRTAILELVFVAVYVGIVGSQKRLKIALPLFLIIFFVAFSFLFPEFKKLFWMSSDGYRVVDGNEGRLAIWPVLLGAVSDGPWYGYGWGQVSVAQYLQANPAYDRTVYVEYSHNFFLDLLVWCGPFMGGGGIAALILWGGKALTGKHSKETLFYTTCLGVFGVHAMLELPHTYSFFLLPVLFIMGQIDYLQNRVSGRLISKFYWVPVIPAFLFFLIAYWVEYRKIEEDFQLMRAQTFGLKVDPHLDLSRGVLLLQGPRELIKYGRSKATKNMNEHDINWMRQVTYRYPLAIAIYRLSVCLALNSNDKEAYNELAKIKIYYGDKVYHYYLQRFEQSIAAGREL